VSVDWNGYEVFDPGAWGPLQELSADDAIAAYGRLMSAKPKRIALLRSLLQRNGIQLGSSASDVLDLEEWFWREIEADEDISSRLRPVWYSVLNDIALALGDLMICQSPGLNWAFFDKVKSDASYQRHVIMGFTRVSNPDFYVDVDAAIAADAHRTLSGKQVPEDSFNRLLQYAHSKA